MQKQTRKSLFGNSCQKWSHNFLKWRDAQAIKLRPMCFLLLPISTIFAWVAVAVGFANNSKKQVGNKSGHHRCTYGLFQFGLRASNRVWYFFSTVEKSYFYIPSTQEIILTAYKKARYTLLTPSILVCVIFGGNHFCGARHKPIHNGSISSSGIDLFGFDFLFRSFSQCCRGQAVFPLIFYQSSNYSFLTCSEEL